jgi:hypothetical protein
MIVTVELLYGRGGGKGIEKDRASAISKCTTSVQAGDIMICTESC